RADRRQAGGSIAGDRRGPPPCCPIPEPAACNLPEPVRQRALLARRYQPRTGGPERERKQRRRGMKMVFFDVDTQLDFLYPAGALYVPGAESIVPRVAALNRYAADTGIPLISTVDAHTEDDPEFRHWPPHCVAGTA